MVADGADLRPDGNTGSGLPLVRVHSCCTELEQSGSELTRPDSTEPLRSARRCGRSLFPLFQICVWTDGVDVIGSESSVGSLVRLLFIMNSWSQETVGSVRRWHLLSFPLFYISLCFKCAPVPLNKVVRIVWIVVSLFYRMFAHELWTVQLSECWQEAESVKLKRGDRSLVLIGCWRYHGDFKLNIKTQTVNSLKLLK